MVTKTMKAQAPAEGILKRGDWGNTASYQVVCNCGDDNHDHNVWIELDDVGIIVTSYTRQTSKWWDLNRWQTIWILLTKGYVEYEAHLIMTEQQVLNYAETLKSAVKNVKNVK